MLSSLSLLFESCNNEILDNGRLFPSPLRPFAKHRPVASALGHIYRMIATSTAAT